MNNNDPRKNASREQQEWQPLRGWEGHYEVSGRGDIRTTSGRIVGQWLNNQGYRLARLASPRAVIRVHRAVAEAFIENPDSKPFVNHLDCMRSNNKASNLEWCTQQENISHSARLGRMQRDHWKGRRSPNARLADETVKQIREVRITEDMSLEALGKRFGISKRAVGRIINRETYQDV